MIKNLSKYTINDFLLDEEFIQWVYHNDDFRLNQQWKNALDQYPEKKPMADKARTLLLSLKFEKDQISFERKIHLSNRIQRQLHPGMVKWPRIGSLLKAASVVLLVITSIWVFNTKITKDTAEPEITKVIVKSNEKGQKSTFRLPDGTTVKLNADSRLTYRENSDMKIREVHLVGEAFFDVFENALVPFVVNAGEIKATVLGTTFNVRNYVDDPNILVALATGSLQVEVEALDDVGKILLKPNEMSNYKKKERNIEKLKYNKEEVFAWRHNTIYFNRASMEEIENKLERWFNVDIKVTNNPKVPVSISTKFTNQSLDNILKNLGFTLNFEYKFADSKVFIQFK